MSLSVSCTFVDECLTAFIVDLEFLAAQLGFFFCKETCKVCQTRFVINNNVIVRVFFLQCCSVDKLLTVTILPVVQVAVGATLNG